MNDPSGTHQELIDENALLKQSIRELKISEAKHKRMEEALRESEERYRSLVDNIDLGISMIDKDFIILNASSVASKKFNKPISKMIGKHCFEEFEKRQTICPHCPGVRAMATGQPQQVDTVGVRDDGSTFTARIRTFPLFHPDGTIRGFNEVFEDLTEKNRTEQALRDSEALFRNLFEHHTAVKLLIDPVTGSIVDANIMATNYYGWTLEQLKQMRIQDINTLPEDDIKKEMENARALNQTHFDFRHRRADGSVRDVEVFSSKIEAQGKELLHSIIHDVSERKQAEEALRQSEATLQSVFKAAPIGLCIVKNRIFHKINKSWSENLGYSESEFIGQSPRILYESEKEYERAGRELFANLRERGPTSVQTKHVKKNGDVCDVILTAVPLQSAGIYMGMDLVSVEDITDRMQKEDELRRATMFLDSIVENIPAMIFVKDAGDLRFVSFNRAGEELLGHSRDDLLGKNDYDFFPKEQADFFAEKDREVLIGKHIVDIPEEPIQTLNKGERILHTKKVPILDASGEPLYLLGIAEDITERKQAEEALRESDEKFKVLVESTPTAVMLYQDDRWIYANSAAEAICGYSGEEILAMNFWDMVHPKAREILKHEGRKRQQGEETTNRHEFKIIAKDGTEKWVFLSGSSTTLHGKPAGIVSVLDITDRKRTERAFLASQRRLSDIIDFLPDATLVIDKNGKAIAWNRAIEVMTGVKKEDILGKGDYEYALPFYGERRPILIDFVLHPDKKIENKYDVVQRSEDTLWGEAFTPNLMPGQIYLSATASVLRGDKGQIVAAIECIRDNTERKKLEERLNRAEKMEALGTLAGGVAHDLNNVIGVLVGYTELLKMQLPEDSMAWAYSDNILQSSMRGAAIIQDLLTMARRGVTVSEVVNLNEMIMDYLKTPEFDKLAFFHPDVKISSNLGVGLLPIKGSPVHLGKTIMNLVSNAAEAISGQGEITIRTENRYLDRPLKGYDEMAEGDFVIVTVSDTGAGIKAEDLGKIFEPFYTKKVMGRSGTGLGLAVVWGTVKDHHGYIDVQSEEGSGTTFTLYFPVTREEPSKAGAAVSPAAYQGKGESILVVDDIKEQRELAIGLLSRLGYLVEAVASGEEAVAYVQHRQPDLIMLDMILEPGIDGLETYSRILDIHPEQKAIVVSGFSETDRVKQALDMGAGSFVQKPYIMEKIGMAIRTELDRKQSG